MSRRRNEARESFLSGLDPFQRALWRRWRWLSITGACAWVGEVMISLVHPPAVVWWIVGLAGTGFLVLVLFTARSLYRTGPPFDRARHWWWPWGATGTDRSDTSFVHLAASSTVRRPGQSAPPEGRRLSDSLRACTPRPS